MKENAETVQISEECHRLEEDSTYSSKSHFNAEAFWGGLHLWVGLLIAIASAAAGITFFTESSASSGYLAIFAAILSGLNTTINPEKLAATHGLAGRKYSSLKNSARIFRTIGLQQTELDVVRCNFRALCKQRDDLNESSPGIPRFFYNRAKKDIEKGYAKYKNDKENV